MLGVAILLFLLGIVAMVVAALSIVLSFRAYQPSWHLVVGVMPSFLIGGFYAVALEIAHRGSLATRSIFWLNAVMGIVCFTQLARRSRKKPIQTTTANDLHAD